MIASDALVLLDTTILVHLARGKAAGRKLRDDYELADRTERPAISVVTVGECLALAKKLNWGPGKVTRLKEIFYELVVVDINRPSVLDKYSEIDPYAEQNGLGGISKNDLWIASCAAAAGAILLTNDHDFVALNDVFLTVEYVDPSSLPRGD